MQRHRCTLQLSAITCCRRPYGLPIYSRLRTCLPFGRVMKSVEPLAAAPLLLEFEGATVLPMIASMSACQEQLRFYHRDLPRGYLARSESQPDRHSCGFTHVISAGPFVMAVSRIEQHQADNASNTA